MTEQEPPSHLEATSDEVTGTSEQTSERTSRDEPAVTGVPEVDAVVSRIQQLDDRPLDEHLAEFELAHQTLRGALDAHPGDPA